MIADPWHKFHLKAASKPQRIIFAEGEDDRVLQAALQLVKQKIAHPILIGSRSSIEKRLLQFKSETNIEQIDPNVLPREDSKALMNLLSSLPKYKTLTPLELQKKMLDPLILGCTYLKQGFVDAFIGGAVRTTADTIRAAFSVLGLSKKSTIIFGLFLIQPRAESSSGEDFVLLADCAAIPDPSAKQLARIAQGAADAYQFFTQKQAKVVCLSFSTQKSADHILADKVREAVRIAHEQNPNLLIDGEWQADAALDIFSARAKGVGESALAGKANVLIAPDLNSGNIAYKLVQRLGGCRAVGPILWGLDKPANDLSRGCSTEDIVDLAALTALQAQAQRKETYA